MKYHLEKISPDSWNKLSRDAHARMFKKELPADSVRIDYAILGFKGNEKEPIGYVTCREIAKDIVYWQYGGIFEEFRGSIASFYIIKECILDAKKKYNGICLFIDNENIPFLKIAIKNGFSIIGTKAIDGRIYLDMYLDFKGVK